MAKDTICKHCGAPVEKENETLLDLAMDLEMILDDGEDNEMENMLDGIRDTIRKIRCIRDGKHFPAKLLKKKPQTKEK